MWMASRAAVSMLPLKMKRLLRNSHLDSAPGNTLLSILHSIILGRLGVEE
jgi:hypothetical protein